MKYTIKYKGYIFSILGAFFAAAYFIPYKAALIHITPVTFVFLLYATGFLINFSGGLISGATLKLDSWTIIGGLVLAALSVVAHISIGKSLQGLDPSLTTVMVRTQILFVVIFESLLLRIPRAPYVYPSALMAVLGVSVMNFSIETAISSEIQFYLWGLLTAACFGSMQLYVKRYSAKTYPITLNYCRLFFGAVFLSAVPGSVSAISDISLNIWMLIIIASLFGPVLSRICQMYALQNLNPSQVVLIDMLAPVFTAALAFIFLGSTLSGIQLIGATIMIAGILMPLIYNLK